MEKIRLSASKGWLEVEATVEQAEELMNTEYHIFEHSTGQEHIGTIPSAFLCSLANLNRMSTACDEYHLPHNVAPHVEIVLPSVHFDAIIEKRSSEQPARTVGLPGSGNGPKKGAATSPNTNSDLSTCDEEITVDCLKALYNISYTPVSGDTNTYGIGLFFIITF